MPIYRETAVDSPDANILLTEYFAERGATFPVDMGHYSAKMPTPADFVPPAGEFVVVDDIGAHGRAIALACGGVRRIADAPDGSTRYEIKHLFVHPRGRGRGFGRQLLGELERRAVVLGAEEIVLDTNDSLEAAGGLYLSSGYQRIEPYNDNPNATTWYGKTMTAPPRPSNP